MHMEASDPHPPSIISKVVLRLSEAERETLKLVVAALKVSEYTDDVDSLSSYRKEECVIEATKEILTAVVGLTHVSGGLSKTTLNRLAQGNANFSELETILAPALEIARRYKRLNPDKLRSEYGKLVMMLQDYAVFDLNKYFGFKRLLLPVKTVGSALSEHGLSDLLSDGMLSLATTPLPPRASQEAVKAKENARKTLVLKYGSDDAGKAELIDRCLKSIDDSVTFVQLNVRPMQMLLTWLDDFERPEISATYSLAIRSGSNGACLTHSHEQQIGYVREALMLWCEVHQNIFSFWETVEQDMLVESARYRFRNTGQGFNRVSAGPLTHSRMMKAIAVTHQRLGGWVGSKVVHLGDNDVPNPLVFIDKYTIIPSLAAPIVSTIEAIEQAFGGSTEPYPGYRGLLLGAGRCKNHVELKYTILRDFFRHGFDGSGDDGGSCIDGRLTSAWNWCSLVHKKNYYGVFLLTGFNGFDSNYN